MFVSLIVWCFSSHSRTFHLFGDVTTANFDLCSALMVIEKWGFFSVSHLLWHGASVYNCYLREPVTLTPIAESLAEELSQPVFTSYVCRCWDSNSQPSSYGANALTHCATVAAKFLVRTVRNLICYWSKKTYGCFIFCNKFATSSTIYFTLFTLFIVSTFNMTSSVIVAIETNSLTYISILFDWLRNRWN